MENTKVFNVKNRSAGVVGYSIPEEKIRREFAPGESKKISWYELDKLSYQPGGTKILEEFLQVYNDEVIQELNLHTEPEYFMSESDIVRLVKEGSYDEWLDALDFAPTGVIDLIKQMSVTIPLNDYNKRVALKQKIGFDIDAAIKNWEAEKAAAKEPAEKPAQRRVQPSTTAAQSPRRTTGKYKIVSQTPASEE